ncbi:hypothetical protein G7A66_01310 [Altererythrobacter sp. SALINAS58]|uniref:hypothetical protein n=1 Tax=Alteripontixanthobacter muriae TaxID=2705546 RepID=UPI0015758D6B|nr:hypothetical protein [Alteripontixanthobacter muriae]NTZ41745.1 hypothetical protein [Alteripontixanthobacter muriae]
MFDQIVLPLTALLATIIVTAAILRGWQGWLALKERELDRTSGDVLRNPTAGRIELADLKERVRQLEAIANGVEL